MATTWSLATPAIRRFLLAITQDQRRADPGARSNAVCDGRVVALAVIGRNVDGHLLVKRLPGPSGLPQNDF
jgi:hypothetical protein